MLPYESGLRSEGSNIVARGLRVAITQPTYLPWLGFFALMDSSDKFVLLDDVQFVRRSWMHRNRVYDCEHDRISFLTIPVHYTFTEKITDVTIADEEWKSSHYRFVKHLFRRAPHSADVMSIMDIVLTTESNRLVDYTVPIIEKIREVLTIKTPILLSSSFPEHSRFAKTQRLIYLVDAVGGATYLAQPTAVQAYLDVEEFRNSNMRLEHFQYEHPRYQTGYDHFEPNMSVLEFIGWVHPDERLDVLRSGTRITTLAEPSDPRQPS